jgi:predicted RNA binding protein with dsRBD fold (UPF0201 family)
MAPANTTMIENVFSEKVKAAFSGLIADYGFRIVESDDSYVRLDSSNASIDVNYDRDKSFEVGIELYELMEGQRIPKIPYNLGEVFREHGVPDANRTSFFQSTDEEAVITFLAKAAALLAKHCEPCLVGDPVTFTALAQRRALEALEYTRSVKYASVNERAKEAWQAKNYCAFVDMLSDPSIALTKTDHMKLEYAKKQCKKGGD